MLDQNLVHAGNQMLVLASTQQHCLPRRHACGLLLQRPEHTVCKGAELAWQHEQEPTAGDPPWRLELWSSAGAEAEQQLCVQPVLQSTLGNDLSM